eukprot:COSAG02_NODE_42394_length_385_cov_0.580420_1_plen_38_part_10
MRQQLMPAQGCKPSIAPHVKITGRRGGCLKLDRVRSSL